MHWNLQKSNIFEYLAIGAQLLVYKKKTHSCIIKTKSVKRKLKIEIFVELCIWSMNITLIVAFIAATAFIKKPIQEMTSKFF